MAMKEKISIVVILAFGLLVIFAISERKQIPAVADKIIATEQKNLETKHTTDVAALQAQVAAKQVEIKKSRAAVKTNDDNLATIETQKQAVVPPTTIADIKAALRGFGYEVR